MLKFIIPGYYLHKSRLKRKSEVLSLYIVYPVFVLFFLFHQLGNLNIEQVLLFIVLQFAWWSVYELGYLENDAITIKKEAKPTLRMSEEEIERVRAGFFKITVIRWGMALAILAAVYLYLPKPELSTFYLLLGWLVLVRLVFYAHNSLRSRWNIVTYFLLSGLKYSFLTLLFVGTEYVLEAIFIMVLSFPLPRTIEHSMKTKYRLPFLLKAFKGLENFRVVYYITALAIVSAVYFSTHLHFAEVLFWCIAYFSAYRIAIFMLVKFSSYKRTEFEIHKSEDNS